MPICQLMPSIKQAVRKATNKEKEGHWEALVVEDHDMIDKEATGANKNEVLVELLSCSLQRDQDLQHQRTQCPPTSPHRSLRRDRHCHQKAHPPAHKPLDQ